jgi:hypothetical protein
VISRLFSNLAAKVESLAPISDVDRQSIADYTWGVTLP